MVNCQIQLQQNISTSSTTPLHIDSTNTHVIRSLSIVDCRDVKGVECTCNDQLLKEKTKTELVSLNS